MRPAREADSIPLPFNFTSASAEATFAGWPIPQLAYLDLASHGAPNPQLERVEDVARLSHPERAYRCER